MYESALHVALAHRAVSFTAQAPVAIVFEGCSVRQARIDLIVLDSVIVEVKAVPLLAPIHFSQPRAYLAATGLHVGLLLNFNSPTLTIKRVVA